MFAPHGHGGWHHYSAALCNALAVHPQVETMHYLIVFREQRTYGVGQEESELLDPKVKVSYLAEASPANAASKYLFFTRNILRWSLMILRRRYDLIHVQTASYGNFRRFSLLLLGWFRLLGAPMIRTVHEAVMPFPTKKIAGIDQWFSRLEWRLPDRFIAHDVSVREQLSQQFGVKHGAVSVIPHGNYLDFRRFLPEGYDEEQIYRSGEPLTVLFFGVKRHKGLEVFLEAWRMLRSEGHPLRALLTGAIGDPELIEEARRLPGIQVSGGYIPNAELWRCFSQSAFVVMPYLEGTTSGAVHLAFAFKRPVITSDLACFTSTVVPEVTGKIVPRNDPAALKEAIVDMAQDVERCRNMGAAGFQLESSEAYAWRTIAETTVETYARVERR